MYAQAQKHLRIVPFHETTSVCDVTLRLDEHSGIRNAPQLYYFGSFLRGRV